MDQNDKLPETILALLLNILILSGLLSPLLSLNELVPLVGNAINCKHNCLSDCLSCQVIFSYWQRHDPFG